MRNKVACAPPPLVTVDQKVANQLKPNPVGLVKPRIVARGYLLDTNEIYEGIPAKEVSELKVFPKDAAPYLSSALRTIELFQRQLESTKHLKRQEAHEAFVPLIQLTRIFSNDVVYRLRFTWDGVIFLDREEGVNVRSARGAAVDFSGFHVHRISGEVNQLEEKS